MNAATASISYAGTAISTNHGLGVTNWVGGAVCAVEAENKAGATYVDLDNVRAWRPNVGYSSGYTNTMAEYPSGIYALAEPERLAIRTWDLTNDWENSYMTNGTLFCIPEKKVNGWQCVNPRRDYHNDVRLNLTTSNVVEVRAAYSNFTQGISRICVFPEYFPGQIFDEYQGKALYVEMDRSGTNLQMSAFRHIGVGLGGRVTIGSAAAGYVQDRGVSFQFDTNAVQVYYGADLVISNAAHGLTNAVDVFTNGVCPHYEFQNATNTTTAVVQMDGLRCRQMSAFAAPSE